MAMLNVELGDQTVAVNVPEAMVQDAHDFFRSVDGDMDRGWQMNRVWVDRPDRLQRCQIVADRLHTAIEQNNQQLATLLAAYILSALPDTARVVVDMEGNMQDTEFVAD